LVVRVLRDVPQIPFWKGGIIMARIYTVPFTYQLGTGAEFLNMANPISPSVNLGTARLRRLIFGPQPAALPNAQNVGLAVTLVSGYSALGSGGSSSVGKPNDPFDVASFLTIAAGNTSIFTGGTVKWTYTDSFYLYAGREVSFVTNEGGSVVVPPKFLVSMQLSAPLSGSPVPQVQGSVEYEEMGGGT
jgi:hypothetical protein